MTTRERIAALKILANIPEKHILPQLRLRAILQQNLTSSRKKCCNNTDIYDSLKPIPLLFPIFPTQGDPLKGLYSLLPFVYISWLIPSKAIPRLEVLEIPIFDKEFNIIAEDRDVLNQMLLPIGRTAIASYSQITIDNMKGELPNMRKRVLKEILKISESNGLIYFSLFSDYTKTPSQSWVSSYLKNSVEFAEETNWEFQSKRLLPIVYNNRLSLYPLKCWILNRKNLFEKI